MAKISSYSTIATATQSDLLLGTDVSDNNSTKNFSITQVGELIAGIPKVKIISMTAADILNTSGGGVSNFFSIIDPVGTAFALKVNSVTLRINGGSVPFNMTAAGSMSLGAYSTTTPVTGFTMQDNFINYTSNLNRGCIPIEVLSTGVGTYVGGYFCEINGKFAMYCTSGSTISAGDGTMVVRVEYTLLDATTLATT